MVKMIVHICDSEDRVLKKPAAPQCMFWHTPTIIDRMSVMMANTNPVIDAPELVRANLEKGKAYGVKLKNISWVIGFASMALVFALTPFVVRMVILTEQAHDYLTGMMLIMGVYMIGRCVNTVTINGVLDGGGDTLFDMYSLAVCMWGIAIPLALLGAFVFHWHVLAVYACTCLDEVGKIPWVMMHFRKYKWVQDLTRQT